MPQQASACHHDHRHLISWTQARIIWARACRCCTELDAVAGASEHDLLVRIVEMLGPVPDHVLTASKHAAKYFCR